MATGAGGLAIGGEPRVPEQRLAKRHFGALHRCRRQWLEDAELCLGFFAERGVIGRE